MLYAGTGWSLNYTGNITHGIFKNYLTHSTFRSPEMFAPARIPVAEGKKMENMPKKLPSFPRQPGTKLVAKMDAGEDETVSLLQVTYLTEDFICDYNSTISCLSIF